MKECKNCKLSKDFSEYRKRSDCKNGILPICRQCERDKENERRAKKIVSYELKICNKCNIEKDLSLFPKFRNSANNCCKSCYIPQTKEDKKEYDKKYRIINKVKKAEYSKKIAPVRKIYNKEYYAINKEKILKYANKRKKERIANDPLYALSLVVRKAISKSFNNKGFKKDTKAELILGCTYDVFLIYIESQFENWMSWENRGKYNGEYNFGWDLDHKEPLSKAKTIEDIMRLNHYTNFQPLCSYTNRYIKRNT
jgi:hypothetical protein